MFPDKESNNFHTTNSEFIKHNFEEILNEDIFYNLQKMSSNTRKKFKKQYFYPKNDLFPILFCI